MKHDIQLVKWDQHKGGNIRHKKYVQNQDTLLVKAKDRYREKIAQQYGLKNYSRTDLDASLALNVPYIRQELEQLRAAEDRNSGPRTYHLEQPLTYHNLN